MKKSWIDKIPEYAIAAMGLLVIVFILMVSYGIVTDCPNTSTYVYCEADK